VLTFNRPYATGREFGYIKEAIERLHVSGKGEFDARCTRWLEERTGAARAFLTPSCTHALEMAALLLDIAPGDELIMPSFTFVTTANSFALRSAVPVFVDIRSDTLNLDETLVEAAITPRTRAVVPVHYAGVGCELDAIGQIAGDHGLEVIEDAAHALMADYRGRALGAIGNLGCVSFHETKNVIAGEGGALLVNDPALIERAEIIQEKGTDRSRFFRGQVDKYTWVELGSSFVMSEINAAFLWAQLEEADAITRRRMATWLAYHERFAELERRELLRRPVVPDHCRHNAHAYYLLLPDKASRDQLIRQLAHNGVQAVFHYVPLHSSPAGRRHGRVHGQLPVTDDVSERVVRLPLWVGMEDGDVDRVVAAVEDALASTARPTG
jgi:dTDP-4-amino-4,6-dideoxygalactose transaminase